MEEIQEIKQFLAHIQPRVGENAFDHVWQTVEELEQKLVKESDSTSYVIDQRKLFDFKKWWNELPDESDDRLLITEGTIERFLKSNSR